MFNYMKEYKILDRIKLDIHQENIQTDNNLVQIDKKHLFF